MVPAVDDEIAVRAPGAVGVPATRRRVLLVVLWLGLAVQVGIWWSQTAGTAVVGTAALMEAGGRLAGLIGGYLLLVQVALMSRVRLIGAAVSGARKSGWHRDLGGYVIGIIALHIVLITLGYAQTAQTGVWHEAWLLLTTNQDMISALAAYLLMAVLGLLAVRAIRTRLPYGLWHATHGCTYLILLFVYGHQFADGQQLVLNRGARIYWTVLYLLVVALLVWGRAVEPVLLNARHRLRVSAVVPEAPGVASIYLAGRALDRFPAIAGQYARWRFLAPGLWWRSHPFSLSAAPDGRSLRITVKAAGDFSARLTALRAGTRVVVEEPAGEFTADHRVRTSAALIAAGSGIAPVRAVLETLPPQAVVLYRARTAEDLALLDEINRIAQRRKAQVRAIVGHRDSPEAAALLTADGLADAVPDLTARDVYVCGPRGFSSRVAAALLAARVPARQIHLDPFEL